jgi:hypothetical protein
MTWLIAVLSAKIAARFFGDWNGVKGRNAMNELELDVRFGSKRERLGLSIWCPL